MREFNKWFLIGLSLIIVTPVFAQEKDEEMTVPPEVQAIDPFAEDAGDFLDVDIMKEYGMKAYEAYNAQDYELAAQYYLAYLRYDIGAAGAIYNLACCYGLLGKDSLAAEYLLRSFEAGFEDIEHIKRDPDFDKVRESEAFTAVMDSITAIAEHEEKKQGSINFVAGSVILPSYIKVPEDFNTEQSYDLLVGLHGWGANPESFVQLWERFGEEPDFIYVAPRAPYAFDIGGDIGYSWSEWTDEDLKNKMCNIMTEQYVLNVVDEMKSSYNIDNVYLMGFSQGGGHSYYIGFRNHDVFAGIMPLGGWLDVEWIGKETIAKASGLPVFIGHGEGDQRVELEAASNAKNVLEEAGYDVTLFTFDGGHSVPEEECQALVQWMRGLD